MFWERNWGNKCITPFIFTSRKKIFSVNKPNQGIEKPLQWKPGTLRKVTEVDTKLKRLHALGSEEFILRKRYFTISDTLYPHPNLSAILHSKRK